jgi:hypothetical protein
LCKEGECFEAPATCPEIVTCSLDCGFDLGCVSNCADEGSPEAQGQFWQIMPCVIDACGFNLSPGCIFGALDGACSEEWEACQTL